MMTFAFHRSLVTTARRKKTGAILCLLLLAMMLIPGVAHASWWNGDWSYRKKITIDAGPKGAALAEDAGRIPLLLRLHDGNFDFSNVGDGGIDIRFVDSDEKTPLNYHIDTYDGLLGMALIWVDVPQLAAGKSHDIWLYYGNAKAALGADAKGTYDSDTTLVYHFGERDAPPRDQTAYGNNAQTATKSVDNSLIGRGVHFDGSAPITLPPSPSLGVAAGGTFTWSAWIKPDAGPGTGVLFARHDGDNALVIGLDQNVPYVSVTTGGKTLRSAPGTAIAPAAWHHIAVTAFDHITLFIDGKPNATLAATLPALNGVASLGADLGPTGPDCRKRLYRRTRRTSDIESRPELRLHCRRLWNARARRASHHLRSGRRKRRMERRLFRRDFEIGHDRRLGRHRNPRHHGGHQLDRDDQQGS